MSGERISVERAPLSFSTVHGNRTRRCCSMCPCNFSSIPYACVETIRHVEVDENLFLAGCWKNLSTIPLAARPLYWLGQALARKGVGFALRLPAEGIRPSTHSFFISLLDDVRVKRPGTGSIVPRALASPCRRGDNARSEPQRVPREPKSTVKTLPETFISAPSREAYPLRSNLFFRNLTRTVGCSRRIKLR